MPYVPIPKENIVHLPLFGYTILRQDPNGVWVKHSVKGVMYIEYINPIVWADDEGEAMQMGTTAIAKTK